jgi:homoserine dehydrogenase
MRVWIVGFGTVGRWLASALHANERRLADRHGLDVTVVGAANERDGFVHDEGGLDLRELLEGDRLAPRPGPAALEGLRATEADLLVEVSASPLSGEPGISHMREALGRGIPVVTSNKWPVALHGVELAALARERGIPFRAESTVMSGTPLLSTLTEGLAGAVPLGLRGLLNATANFILTRMHEGSSYEDALAEAQAAGLAERDPAADVEGHDSVAKVMILSALVFGRELRVEDVERRGIHEIADAELEEAAATGRRIKHVAMLEFDGARATARVRPELVAPHDLLSHIEGTTNAVVCRADPVGEITVAGPGAGPELAGQGVLSDVIAVARAARR